MESSKLIINLIKQDLKHNQLLNGLQQLGFNTDAYSLDILSVVAELMQVPDNTTIDNWAELYLSYMENSTLQEDAVLEELAERCYGTLALLKLK